MSQITSPMLLDSTGQSIVSALNNISAGLGGIGDPMELWGAEGAYSEDISFDLFNVLIIPNFMFVKAVFSGGLTSGNHRLATFPDATYVVENGSVTELPAFRSTDDTVNGIYGSVLSMHRVKINNVYTWCIDLHLDSSTSDDYTYSAVFYYPTASQIYENGGCYVPIDY